MEISYKVSLVAFVVLGVFSLVVPIVTFATTAPNLGTASSFAVLAGSAVTDSNPAAGQIFGNVGLSPAAGTFYTGLTKARVTGFLYTTNAAGPAGYTMDPGLLTIAKNDLATAYGLATTTATTTTRSEELGGATLAPGVYGFGGWYLQYRFS